MLRFTGQNAQNSPSKISLTIIVRNGHHFQKKEKIISYKNLLSLQSQLQAFLVPSTIRVTILSFSPPRKNHGNEKEMITCLLEKLPNLIKAGKLGLFNKTQKERLKKAITKNKQSSDWSIHAGIVFGLVAILCSVPVLNTLVYMATSIFVVKNLTKWYQEYIKSQLLIYNKSNRIPNIKDATVQQSLVAGIDSHYWRGYLLSFTKIETYFEYGAYISAKAISTSHNASLIEKINKLRIS